MGRKCLLWLVGAAIVGAYLQGESAMTEKIWHIRLPAPFNLEFDLKGESLEDLQINGDLRAKEAPYEPQCDGKRCRIYLGDAADDYIAEIQGRKTSYSPVYIRFEIVDIDPGNPEAIRKLLERQKGHTKAAINTGTSAHGVAFSSVTYIYTGGASYSYTLLHHLPAILVSNDFSLLKESVTLLRTDS